MKNNAIVNTNLGDLLNLLDARAFVNIFAGKNGDKCVKANRRVYELLSDKEFLKAYADRQVTGLLTLLNSISIMVEEA